MSLESEGCSLGFSAEPLGGAGSSPSSILRSTRAGELLLLQSQPRDKCFLTWDAEVVQEHQIASLGLWLQTATLQSVQQLTEGDQCFWRIKGLFDNIFELVC